MPRTKGQTNSRNCFLCTEHGYTNRVIERDYLDKTRRTPGGEYRLYDFDSYWGPLMWHTCTHHYQPTNDEMSWGNGKLEVGTEPTFNRTPASPEPTLTIQEPTPAPVAPALDLAELIETITTAIEEPVKETATAAALAVVPVEHKYTVTSNGAVVSQGTGRPHFKMERILKSLSRRLHTWMAGPAGSGKTTAASTAAEMLGLPYYEISLGPATSQWDLNGFKNANGEYVPGEMREAYEHGGVMMLDEIDNANPSVLVAINAALANGYGNFPDARVKKHADFVCIAGANTFGSGANRMYVGRNQIDAATLDRFKFIDFGYDEDAEFDWAGQDQTEWVRFVQRVRRAATERQLRVIVSPRASINGAIELRDGEDWNTVADEWIWNKMSPEDSSMLKSVVNRY